MKQIERDAVINIIKEAEKANISRLVYLSGYDSQKDFLEKYNILEVGEIKLEIEMIINDSNFNWTILGCPPSFALFFNFLKKNKMGFPGGGKNYLPTISPEDLGEIAAQTVIRDDLSGIRIKLTGPDALSIPEAARKISQITNTEIKTFSIPLLIIKLLSFILLPFNPFVRYLYKVLVMFNNFPPNLVEEIPSVHQFLLETFSYTPHTFEMEVKKRMETNLL